MTLKDLLILANHKLEEINESLRHTAEQQHSLRISTVLVLGVACLVLVWTLGVNRPDIEFLNKHNIEITIAGLMSGGLSILLAAEGIPLIKVILRSIPCRIAIGFFFALIAAMSTATANGAINQVLGIDASNAPIARALLTAALVLKAMQPIFFALLTAAALQAMAIIRDVVNVFRGDSMFSDISGSTVVVTLCCIVLSVIYLRVLLNGFKDEAIPAKAYILAHRFDFNDRALCLEGRLDAAEARHWKYLFVGANQQKVLVGPRLSTSELGSWFFIDPVLADRLGRVQPRLLDCAGGTP